MAVRDLHVNSLHNSRRRWNYIFQKDNRAAGRVGETKSIKRSLAARSVVAGCCPSDIEAATSLRIQVKIADGARRSHVVFSKGRDAVSNVESSSGHRFTSQRWHNISVVDQQVLQLLDRQVRILRQEQSGGTGHMRR